MRGPGLFLGFELIGNPETLEPAALQAAYLANRMRELGVLMSTDGPFHNVLKIKPPVVFSRKDADFLVEMLEQVMKEDVMNGVTEPFLSPSYLNFSALFALILT